MKVGMVFKCVGFIVLPVVFLVGCGNCEKVGLTEEEKRWVNHFAPGQKFAFKSNKGEIDTLLITDTSNYYTLCNKFELSEYQSEIAVVRFTLKSRNDYANEESFMSVTAEENKKHNPYIYFGNLGPYLNDLKNRVPAPIDTVLDGVRLTSVYYYTEGLNTEQYGEKKFFKNFFWNKQSGLVAYTTIRGEFFLRATQ